MKRLLIFLLIVIAAPFIAGVYGMIHDQISYTISPEYYTKFKFIQFGFMDSTEVAVPEPQRLYAALVGLFATWWMGIPIGLILGCVSFIFRDYRNMFKAALGGISVTVVVAFVTGIAGLAYGKIKLAHSGVGWWLPPDLLDTENFIAVGSMHNFSYLGGLTGLVAGIIFLLVKKKKLED